MGKSRTVSIGCCDALRRMHCQIMAIAVIAGVMATASQGNAARLFSDVLPEFNGPPESTGFPLPPIIVGTYAAFTTGESLIEGTISGTFGNSAVESSSGVDLYLGDGGDPANDVLVGKCVEGNACTLAEFAVPWVHTFDSQELELLRAINVPLVLSAVQTSETYVRLGTSSLVGETAVVVPEPRTLMFAIAIFLSIVCKRRI